MNKKKIPLIFGIAGAVCLIAVLASLCLGATNITAKQLLDAILKNDESIYSVIFLYVRLPRTGACILAGAGFAVSGAIIQSVLANKLASPGIIGVNAGAGMAVTICCAFGAVSGWLIAGASFIGAVFAVLLVAFTAQKINASRTTVILGGVAINSFFAAISDAVVTLIPEAGVLSTDFRIGGFSSVSHVRIIPAAVLIVIALVMIFCLCNELDIMSLGEETAHSLGLNVSRMRTIFLVLAALLAGASVSFAGLLGFVGLIVPHIMRRFVGSESRYLLPLCTMGGAGFVTLCDVVAKVCVRPYEMPVGVLMSFIGGPFFIWLLLKKKGGHAHG